MMRSGWMATACLALSVALPGSADLAMAAEDRSPAGQGNLRGLAVDAPRAEQQLTRARASIREALGPNRSHALVIGVSEFDHPDWRHLSGVQPEVGDVAEALATHGFQVEKAGGNSGRLELDTLKKTIRRFLDSRGSQAGNRLVIYIATHGYAAVNTDGRSAEQAGHLIASDSLAPDDEGFRASTYSVADLARDLSDVQAQHVFLVFNACFSGAMVPSVAMRSVDQRASLEPPSVDGLSSELVNWTQRLLNHNARLVLTAGSAGQQVPDVGNPFARAVTGGLYGEADLDGDGLILGTELAAHVRSRVARETRRAGAANDPVFAFLPKRVPPDEVRPDFPGRNRVDYSINGDFLFLSPRGASPAEQDLARERLERLNERLAANEFVDCVDCPPMVEVPRAASPSNEAQRLALSRTEITFSQWDACYRALGCRRWIDDDGRGRGDRPVRGLTWQDALDYVDWLNDRVDGQATCKRYRLPTRDQWEMAARAGSSTRFSWGDELVHPAPARCEGCDDAEAGPARVASYPPNAFGFHDMTGNVWEWVRDPQSRCRHEDLTVTGQCSPGTVMGGSYATDANRLSTTLAGQAPRTLATGARAHGWPTVGLRVACRLPAREDESQ